MKQSPMHSLLPPDQDLLPGQILLVSASAGAGKTYNLAQRFIQLLLSSNVSDNSLRNLIALTFTNNAAKEMRKRVVEFLKLCALRDEMKVKEFSTLCSSTPDEIAFKATVLLDVMMSDAESVRIGTIDSFLQSIFVANAREFGYAPDMAPVFSHESILDQAFFDLALKAIDSDEWRAIIAASVDEILDVQKGDPLWNPFPLLRNRILELLNRFGKFPGALEFDEIGDSLELVRSAARDAIRKFCKGVERSGLEPTALFNTFRDAFESGDVDDILRRKIPSPPVKKGKNAAKADRIVQELEVSGDLARKAIEEFVIRRAIARYSSIARLLSVLDKLMKVVRNRQRAIHIDDVKHHLAAYVTGGIFTELYFKIGETIRHYLYDEFQDTTPLQWSIMKPLAENALSGGGSLFVVGDKKQSIYYFNGADWRIFGNLEAGVEFPQFEHRMIELQVNYRSGRNIIEFNRKMFQELVPLKYPKEGKASGLDNWYQTAREDRTYDGYVNVNIVKRNDDTAEPLEKILKLVRDVQRRGYLLSDVAILAKSNQAIIEISAYLNSNGIPFISHSSLDIRNRTLIREILAFLSFLNDPTDDYYCSAVFTSGLLEKVASSSGIEWNPGSYRSFLTMRKSRREVAGHLYTSTRLAFPQVWDSFIEPLFNRVGFSSMYELLSDLLSLTRVFELFADEHSALVKLLECAYSIESEGRTGVSEFVQFANRDDNEADWEMSAPAGLNAVRLMTIHKAKGLTFRVTIVLLEEPRIRIDNMQSVVENGRVKLIHITKGIECVWSDQLRAIYTEEEERERVDWLNQLYVALTRAADEMHIVAVCAEENSVLESILPPSAGKRTRAVSRSEHRESPSASIRFSTKFQGGVAVISRGVPSDETERGERIHRILASIEFLPVGAPVRFENFASLFPDVSVQDARQGAEDFSQLVRFLGIPEVQDWFSSKEGREIFREVEYCDSFGNLKRIDRIVRDGDSFVVIDFKTGSDLAEDEYRDQVSNYVQIVRSAHPGSSARGLIGYVDLQKVVEVNE